MDQYFEIDLRYGDGHQHLKMPAKNLLHVAHPPKTSVPAKDEAAELRRSLENPIGTRKLREIAGPGKSVVIIVTDHTRKTPSKKVVPLLLEELSKGGVQEKNVRILFATGTHRPTTREEMRKILGDDIFNRIHCESHDSENAANFISLGKSSFGTPIEINRVALDADIRITVNMLEPHQSAGWSGGAKNIMPGISSSRTVFHHHAHSTNPAVCIGRIEGNPFKEDIDEIGARVGVHFSMDVVLSEKAELIKAFSGDLIQANREGARFARELISVPLTRKADIVIGAVGGAPRDSTLWQAEGKILTRIMPVVRPGGVAILVAECADGFGDQRFEKFLNAGPPSQIMEDFKKQKFTVLGNKAFRIAQFVEKSALFLVTRGLSSDQFKTLPIHFFAHLQAAFDQAINMMGDKASVLIVPNTAAVLLEPQQRAHSPSRRGGTAG